MYYVEQLAIFLENKKGVLKDFSEILSKKGVDLISLSIADTNEFGIVRAITDDNAKAVEVLRKEGFLAKLTKVLCIAVNDVPGGIYSVFDMLEEQDISVEYVYSLARQEGHKALIIIKVDKSKEAVELFAKKGIEDASKYFEK